MWKIGDSEVRVMTTELYKGDCLEIMDTLIAMGVKIDAVLTSPPYNRKRNDKYSNYDDTIKDYYSFLVNTLDKLLKISKNYIFFNIQTNYYNKQDVYKIIGKYADKIQNIIIWEKSNPLPASGFNITNSFEYILVFGDKPLKSNKTYTKNHITTAVNTESTTKIHKAVMKQEVSDWIIENFTKNNQTILDPFMGLGTTGKSCKQFGRNFIGIELDNNYFNIAKERINDTRES